MVGICTDAGNVRKVNEDYADFYENELFSIYVIADGMGGHNAGEVASKQAVDDVIDYLKENYNNESDHSEILKKAICEANYRIYVDSLKNELLNGMGTTITACFVTRDYIQVANVGDSSCLAIKGDTIRKITKDHSLVQELLDSGSITEIEAKNHPHKNVITRAMGTASSVNVDIFSLEKEDFDTLILCSDGLTNELNNDEILETVKNSLTLNESAEKLISLAKQRGGRDNITALIYGGER